jgi:hypothetical protein
VVVEGVLACVALISTGLSVQVGRGVVQHREVAGLLDVTRRDEGEPEEVVGHPRDVAGLGEGVPPVVDRAVHELVGGVEPELLPAALRVDGEPDLGVLELVAEAVGAALLVVAGPAPDAGRDRLVAEPVVEDRLEVFFPVS